MCVIFAASLENTKLLEQTISGVIIQPNICMMRHRGGIDPFTLGCRLGWSYELVCFTSYSTGVLVLKMKGCPDYILTDMDRMKKLTRRKFNNTGNSYFVAHGKVDMDASADITTGMATLSSSEDQLVKEEKENSTISQINATTNTTCGNKNWSEGNSNSCKLLQTPSLCEV
mmetsp:Transcript_26774/g.57541  ORF Transcript_26774/g.57541 Transcript_26774/m.57541 type:complete len:171 (-) Transcript_26774:2573-3085(-)